MATALTTMKVALLLGNGGLEKLEVRGDVAAPTPDVGEAMIRVHACGMNNTDINTRTGWYSKSVTEGTTSEGGEIGFSRD